MHAHASGHRLLHVCVMFIHQRLYLKSSGSIKLAYCKNSVSRYKNLCSVHCICRALGTVVIGSFEINFQSSCNTYIGCFTLLIIAFFPTIIFFNNINNNNNNTASYSLLSLEMCNKFKGTFCFSL